MMEGLFRLHWKPIVFLLLALVFLLSSTSLIAEMLFEEKVDYAVEEGPHSIIAADLNGDTYPDLAVVNTKSDHISMLFNTGIFYQCGDVNCDEMINVSDAVHVINYVFLDSYPPEPLTSGDTNCDGTVNVSDPVKLISYIFIGGSQPCDYDNDNIPDC